VKEALMKAFGRLFLFAVMAFSAFSSSFASEGTIVCFDITADVGKNITHIFVASTPTASEYAITVDGIDVDTLHTDDGPCESISRDVWFPLHNDQDTAVVCVSVLAAGPADIQVYTKVDNECITGTTPLVSIDPVE